jgi:hypothetical protein
MKIYYSVQYLRENGSRRVTSNPFSKAFLMKPDNDISKQIKATKVNYKPAFLINVD